LRYAMKIILNRDVAIGGRHYAVGETVDVSNVDALALINMGKATWSYSIPAGLTAC